MDQPLDQPLSPNSPTAPSADVTTNGAEPTTDLWSSILDSVSGTRGVVTKNVIVLGTHNTGKSTLISRLSSPTGAAPNAEEEVATAGSEVLDLGLSYSFLDVGDEADEETVARLGVYQLPSPLPPYPSLLPLALSKATLLDSLVVIVLDWERPWQFLRDLQGWMGVLDGVLKVRGTGEGWEGAEGRERLEAHLRHYFEPSTTTAASAGPSASQLADTDAPLLPGVLTDNLGLGIVIVCTKADQINSLERDKDFKEEQFDYVQQSLRTIALKYGAALFFTSHSRPTSFAKLRAYILHRLFFQSSPTALAAVAGTVPSTSTSATSRAFAFPHRANVVDRDQVLVPAGWDSWGKIRILRDRFDADAVGKGWDLDMEREKARLVGGPIDEEEKLDGEGWRVISAMRMYEDNVADLDGDDQPINMANLRVEAQDEQDFLKTHYETLQKDREKDPRAAFAARPNSGSALNGVDSLHGASVVGPMASSSLSLPSVERALERDPEDVTARLAKMVRKDSSQGARSPNSPAFASPPLGSTPNGPISSSLAPPSTPGAAAGGQAQNEVLANFFQSLLAARTTGTGAARPGGVQSLNPPLSSSQSKPPSAPAGPGRSSSQTGS